jgi:uncharacterized membrane protein
MAWSDERIDRAIGTLLRVGVIVSALIVLAGSVAYLAGRWHSHPDYRSFRAEPVELRRIGGILKGAARGNPLSCIKFGILLLIATPIARVSFSICAFAAQRDWIYVAISLTVLLILITGLAGI